MNLYDIKYNISIINYDDVANTIILNKYGSKNIIFHWSDLTCYKSKNLVFIAHNIYFVWGNIHYDYHAGNCFVDKKINIGCIFKREHNKAINNKENIIAQIDPLMRKNPIITFFDTSFHYSLNLTEEIFLEYLKIIKEFCKGNKDNNILLKPKYKGDYERRISHENRNKYRRIWDEIIKYDNFINLNPSNWKIEEIISISDICVSMGMNSPSTIALICGKNALYFDNTGNFHHPFSKKYKNLIVFEDKDRLFKQIDNILNMRFDCRDVISEREIREYDAFTDDNALKRMRDSLYKLTS